MVRALALEGSPEAAGRKAAILNLYLVAGRSGELGWLNWDSLEWDPYFRVVCGDMPQTKVSKTKKIAFVAGACRELCFFLAFGDTLVMVPQPTYDDEDGKTTWMHPALHDAKSPGTMLGKFFKALQPRERGGAEKYAAVAVDQLPPNPSAGGIRPGVCNELFCRMPVELVVALTGHDLRSASALFEYVDSLVATLMIACVHLAGWPTVPWGQNTMSPVPADSDALVFVDRDALTKIMNSLFNLDDASPPAFRVGGTLYPLVRHAFATQLMYYPERVEAREMTIATTRLRGLYAAEYRCGHPAAHAMLVEWSGLIRGKFDRDNLHLTARQEATGSAQVVAAITGLGSLVEKQASELQLLREQMSALRIELSETRRALLESQDALLASQAAQHVAPPPLAQTAQTAAPASLRPPTPQPPAAAAESTPRPPPLPAARAGAATPGVAAAAASPQTWGTMFMAPNGTENPTKSLAGKDACVFYRECMQRGGSLPPLTMQDGRRGQLVLEFFNAMASPAERKLLLSREKSDQGQQRRVAEALNDLVVQRFELAFSQNGGTVPAPLRKTKAGKYQKMKAGSIESRLAELKTAKPGATLVPDATAFAEFSRERRSSLRD
jgi:GGDEF domain-containing protein